MGFQNFLITRLISLPKITYKIFILVDVTAHIFSIEVLQNFLARHGHLTVKRIPTFVTGLSATFNPLTPNDHCSGRTAPLISKRCILYIYSTNIGTEYFKHGIYSQFRSLQNTVCFIILTYLVSVLFTFYIQGVLKLKKIIPAPKG